MKKKLLNALPVMIVAASFIYIITLYWMVLQELQNSESKSQFWAHRYWMQFDSTAIMRQKYDSLLDDCCYYEPRIFLEEPRFIPTYPPGGGGITRLSGQENKISDSAKASK